MATQYEVLEMYAADITDRYFIREYADGVSFSAYINNKQIHIEGHYDIVLPIVMSLYNSYRQREE